jgi:hypothetical protein
MKMIRISYQFICTQKIVNHTWLAEGEAFSFCEESINVVADASGVGR